MVPHHVAPADSTPRRAAPSVLLADDDEQLRWLVADALRACDFDVTEAEDGGRLLVRIARAYERSTQPRAAFDVIVADVRMPVCTGLQVLESLRRAHWHTPVILMTAHDDASVRSKAEALGALLLTKPFEIEDLAAAVAGLSGRPTVSDG